MPRESELVDSICNPCRTLLRNELDDPGRSAPDPLAPSRELSSEWPSSFFVLLRIDILGGQYTYNRANCMCAVSLCGRKGLERGNARPVRGILVLRAFAIFSRIDMYRARAVPPPRFLLTCCSSCTIRDPAREREPPPQTPELQSASRRSSEGASTCPAHLPHPGRATVPVPVPVPVPVLILRSAR